MSARANAPVFQLHPSATAMGEPPQPLVAPAPQGFTPMNAAHLVPHPPPHQQPTPAPQAPSGPVHTYHQRTDSDSSQGRRRHSSFSRRRTDARSRSSVPPQLHHPLPQLQPASEADLVSGPKTTSVLETHTAIKREGESGGLAEPQFKRRREEGSWGSRRGSDTLSVGGRSPDRSSLHSEAGSVTSMKREELKEQPSAKTSPEHLPSPP
jgi:hypothetical protein